MKSPAVTVLILNWNGKRYLDQFLPSVLSSTYPNFEVLVADNGSEDGSIEFLERTYPEVRILDHGHNYGFTEGNNKALPHIDSPYVVLLNSDVEVSSGWLEPLVALAESDESVASVQPKIRAFHQKTHFEYAGASGGYMDRYAYPFCRGRLFDELEADEGQYEDARQVFWATGACCLLRKSILDEIGLFEPSFFAHMEEIDFCWRAQNKGYKIMVEPKSMVYHVGGGTLPQGNPWKTFLNVHNSLAMMYKNLPANIRFGRIFTRLMLDGVWGMRSLLGGDFKTVWAILRAHFRFYSKLGFWKERRMATYGEESIPMPQQGWLDKSIVWQHFAKGKKNFSDLLS